MSLCKTAVPASSLVLAWLPGFLVWHVACLGFLEVSGWRRFYALDLSSCLAEL